MLQKRVLEKILKTGALMLLLLTLVTIPNITTKEKVLRTNLEIEDITNLNTNRIYLLNKNGLLVESETFVSGKTLEEKVRNIIHYLTIENNSTPMELNGYIPKQTKLINCEKEDNTLKVNLSKEFLNYKKEEENKIITGFVYSLLEIEYIDNIWLEIEGKPLNNYNYLLNKNIGINNKYNIFNRKNIKKVVIYYLDKTQNYYIPVTKYINDNREKIEIIIEELNKKDLDSNWISTLNKHIKLLEYKEEGNVLYLNFNKYLKNKNKKTEEKSLNSIAYSIFENYDVNMVIFEINKEKVKQISRK